MRAAHHGSTFFANLASFPMYRHLRCEKQRTNAKAIGTIVVVAVVVVVVVVVVWWLWLWGTKA